MAGVKTAIALWGDRHIPATVIAQQARALESGGVDGMLIADQFGNFIPPQLWKPEIAPAAAVLPDPDSHSDPFTLAGYLLAAAPTLDVAVSTDSVRRGPGELVQAALTLANMTEGEVTLQVGGGEAKQCAPFGYKRSQGMSRMEDLFRIFGALLDSGGEPIDFEGRRWHYTGASIGGAVPHRPKIMGLGGGPILIDHSTSYADGLATTCPPVWAGPDEFGQAREQILKTVAAKGRNPEEFEFAVWFPCLIGNDQKPVREQIRQSADQMAGGGVRSDRTDRLGQDRPRIAVSRRLALLQRSVTTSDFRLADRWRARHRHGRSCDIRLGVRNSGRSRGHHNRIRRGRRKLGLSHGLPADGARPGRSDIRLRAIDRDSRH